MASSDTTDTELLWYLGELSNKEFQSVKEHLVKAPLEFGLEEIPWYQLRNLQREEVHDKLTTNYEAHITWNMMFSIFQKINRQDLCKKISDRRTYNQEAHRQFMDHKAFLRWKYGVYPNIHDELYEHLIPGVLQLFQITFDRKSEFSAKDFNMYVVGAQASGKSMYVKMVMVLWGNGKLWQDLFSYVIYLPSQRINNMTYVSLVDLLSKDWSGEQAPVADILSDPQRLLFILEDLDNVRFNLNIPESALCKDSRKKVPVNVLLLSLLKRTLAPDSTFLITTRIEPRSSSDTIAKKTDFTFVLNFGDEVRKKYFTLFFKDEKRVETAFKFVQENEILMDLCSVPILCWLTCMNLKEQMDKDEEDVTFPFQTTTDVFAHFLANALTSEAGVACARPRLILLQRLCWLAFEGLLQDVFHFSGQDLLSVGLNEADASVLQTTRILMQSTEHHDRCMFIHLRFQEFCAAIAYMMPLNAFLLPSIQQTIGKREEYNDLTPIMTHIFGLLNEKTREILETSLGCLLLPEMHRQHFLERVEDLGANPTAMEHHVPLFHCLFENQEEEFVNKIMDFFVEATVLIQENKDMIIAAYCLKRCHPLEKLRLCIQGILAIKEPDVSLTSCKLRSLVHWKEFCSLLYTKENLRELEICNSVLDETSERILGKALMHPTCHVETLKLTYLAVDTVFEELFKFIIQSLNLMHLNLTCVTITLKMFSLLFDVLTNPMSNVHHLSLMKCDLRTLGFKKVSSLFSCQKLKRLTLSNNTLSVHEVDILCDALLHPNCTLESLVLFYCCITDVCCFSIGRVIMFSKTLKHLDVGVNFLQNYGGLILILSLLMSTSQLKELELSGSFITARICPAISIAMLASKTLRSLELGSNNLGDEGVALLCNALKHRNCKLENLGLEECMLTATSGEILASVFTINKTLRKLNLLGNNLGEEGIVHLLHGLGHPDCMLQTIGLQVDDVSRETYELFCIVKERKTNLFFVAVSWAKKEDRKISEKIGQHYDFPEDKYARNVTWHLISTDMPRVYRETR